MELLKEQLDVTETKFKDKAIAYAEGDIIVPDIKPDILKILQVDAVALIKSKEISDGVIKITGVIKCNIIYIPEKEGESVKSITSEIPFSHNTEKKSNAKEFLADVNADMERVEFTLLNSRKLNIKTAISIFYTVWERKELSLATGISYETAEIIYEPLNIQNLNILEEIQFTVRDRLGIPSGRAAIAEILKMDINVADREIKAITGKAVMKGNISVCVLYADVNGEVNCIDGEIPFTEIAEIFDLEEDAVCEVEYRLGDFSYECGMDDDGEPRTVEFDITLNALISSYEQKGVRVMKDCFCPGCRADMAYDTLNTENVIAAGNNRYTVKEIIVPDKKIPQIASVYNVIAKPTVSKVTAEEGKILTEGKLEVYVLYITEDSGIPVYSFKKDIPFNFLQDNEFAKPQMICAADAVCEHIAFNMNMANEVELRCILSVSTRLSEKTGINVISGCTLSEEEKECGIVIYYVQPGDSVWEIAKRYSVSVGEIVKFNNIQNEDVLEAGERLIIPFC